MVVRLCSMGSTHNSCDFSFNASVNFPFCLPLAHEYCMAVAECETLHFIHSCENCFPPGRKSFVEFFDPLEKWRSRSMLMKAYVWPTLASWYSEHVTGDLIQFEHRTSCCAAYQTAANRCVEFVKIWNIKTNVSIAMRRWDWGFSSKPIEIRWVIVLRIEFETKQQEPLAVDDFFRLSPFFVCCFTSGECEMFLAVNEKRLSLGIFYIWCKKKDYGERVSPLITDCDQKKNRPTKYSASSYINFVVSS